MITRLPAKHLRLGISLPSIVNLHGSQPGVSKPFFDPRADEDQGRSMILTTTAVAFDSANNPDLSCVIVVRMDRFAALSESSQAREHHSALLTKGLWTWSSFQDKNSIIL